eukprot:RCo001402
MSVLDDPRFKWLFTRLKCCAPTVDEVSFRLCLERDGLGEQLKDLFADTTKERVCVFYLSAGDLVAEDDDSWPRRESYGDEAAAKKAGKMAGKPSTRLPATRRTRHQRLNLTFKHVPDVVLTMENVSCVFFLKHALTAVTDENCADVIDKAMEFGKLDAPTLNTMQQLMMNVFLPMLEDHEETYPTELRKEKLDAAAAADAIKGDAASVVDSVERAGDAVPTEQTQAEEVARGRTALHRTLKTEVYQYIQRLNSQATSVLHQVSGDCKLRIPSIPATADGDLKAIAESEEQVQVIDDAVAQWNSHITAVIEQEQSKDTSSGKGPLSEIEFWRDRYAVLSAIYEQLSLPSVKFMLRVLKEVDGTSYPNFEISFGNLAKLYHEAKDNVKFLSTLERHFRNIQNVQPGQSLQPIIDTLPSMMTAIRMVWIISRYYNTDERMMGLLEKIANTIAEKVAKHINVRTILRQHAADAKRKILEGRAVLRKWKDTYIKERDEIERSDRDARWEFDKKRLFDTTKYMEDRCGELYEIACILEYYHTVLGSQLKAVTKDTQGIDAVMKNVEDLVKPIETVAFDIFDKRAKQSWERVYKAFTTQVAHVDDVTKKFIDASFRKLRSAEGAFDLLQNFKNLQSRGGSDSLHMSKLLSQKSDGILIRYLDEIKGIEEIFKSQMSKPPLTKNQPPVAGAIHWSESLFQRIKKPIMRFQTEDILSTPKGKEVRKKYVDVARQMKDYATGLFDSWVKEVSEHTVEYLKAPILRKDTDASGRTKVLVNFDPNLFQIIQEARYLDRLGYAVPPVALNVSLQDEKYHGYVENLKSMLSFFNETQAIVEPPERAILGAHLEALEAALAPGFRTLNWNSLGIAEFIHAAHSAINKFHSKVKEIQKNAQNIAVVVHGIATTCLVVDPRTFAQGSELLDIQELYDNLEQYRNDRIDACFRRFHTIAPLLVKIEGTVCGTVTGKAPVLKTYYAHWERKIYKALQRMVLMSLSVFQNFLNVHHSKSARAASSSNRKKPPLFKITASLVANEICTSPAMGEIQATLSKVMRNIIESTNLFVRWMDGTCIECTLGEISPKPTDERDSPVLTFLNDISQNSQVMKLQTMVYQGIQKTFFYVNKYLESWKRFASLWTLDKQLFIEKLAAKNLTWLEYDRRFEEYTKLIRGIDNYPQAKDIDFVCVDCNPLLAEIQKETRVWIVGEGKQLNDLIRQRLHKLQANMQKYSDDLEKPCDSIDELKFVLSVIANMKTQSMDIEMQYREIEHCYSALRQYAIPVPPEEAELAANLRHFWANVMEQARRRDEDLGAVKDKFRRVTQDQVREFAAGLQQAKHTFADSGPGKPGMDLDKGLELVKDWKNDLAARQKKRDVLIKAEKLFGLEITTFTDLTELEKGLADLTVVYDVYEDWKENLTKWSNQLWVDVQTEVMTKVTESFLSRLKKMDSKYKELEPFNAINDGVRNFFDSFPLFKDLKHEALRDRHWKMLMEVTGKTFDFANFTLQNLVDMQLFRYKEEILNIVAGAARELSIEKAITAIKDTWRAESFSLKKYERNGMDRGYVLMDTSEISEKIDDNIMNLQSISNVKWVRPFLNEVHLWEKKLALMGEVIMVWMVVQMKWMYLESIFVGSEDIANQLPREAKKFEDIDKRWAKIMVETFKSPNVDYSCHVDGRLADFTFLAAKLDECQKGLSDYLETKRMAFPRFYFISDDELLSILGSSSPRAVQEHMLKMFDNSALLLFKGESNLVEGVQSAEGEVLTFLTPVSAENAPVEKWLTVVLGESMKTLRRILKEGTFFYPRSDRLEWIQKYHGMVACCGSSIWWTFQVEDAFRKVKQGKKQAVKELAMKLTRQLNDLVGEMDKPIEKKFRKKVNTMIIIDVHARDIVDRFVRDSVMDPREFEWESQLRFYWDRTADNCLIRQCTGTFTYGHEYMGLNGRLVITPLTDRCFMTLTQALTFKLGGSPAGPAGTGKTESVKDLAKSLAIFCVVFNCGEGLDYKAMASIFSGLCQCGAWGCFDEFNRIELPVLSVVAEQLRTIQQALRLNQKKFLFMGDKDIALDSKVGVFITMNPGYAGRVELPDNLKALFRPCVMVVPDMEIICEIMLFSEGFKTARVLAKKMVSLYSLARGQLSKQYHYDWGLRALKSVLVMAGALKRGEPDKPEDVVLMRALRDMNAPKFVFEDVPLFHGLINDLFPDMDVERVAHETLAKAVQVDLKAKGFQILPVQVDKVVQLYETMQTRHTTMVVGPTGGGKSVIIRTLQNAQTDLKLPTRLFTVNAKAQGVSELYGVLDATTRTWTDGIFSNIFRAINRVSDREGADRERKYVVFDGDVDALWVENMNSVMDDNKLLTLPNGERIRLHPTCSLLFEVGDLQYASPATVSRCGMVYVDPKNLGWTPYAWKWMNSRNKEEAETLRELFQKYVKPCVDFVLDGVDSDGQVGKPPRLALPLTDLNMVRQLCTLLSTVLTERKHITEPKLLEGILIFCLVWSLGGAIVQDDRKRFDTFLKYVSGWPMQDNGEKLDRLVGVGSLPERLTLYEYFPDDSESRWKPWKLLVEPFSPPADRKFSSILVPTVDTVRTSWMVSHIVAHKSPCLLIGSSGTAKTVTVQNFLKALKLGPGGGAAAPA